jgi:hypothetical protein
MISQDGVCIMTTTELETKLNNSFQRGIERGKIEKLDLNPYIQALRSIKRATNPNGPDRTSAQYAMEYAYKTAFEVLDPGV